MLSRLSQLAIRQIHPRSAPSHSRTSSSTAAKMPVMYHRPAPGRRAFHHAAGAHERATGPRSEKHELDTLLAQFRQAATTDEREQAARQISNTMKSMLGRIYLSIEEEDPGQALLTTRIVEHFSDFDVESLRCLRQALGHANFSVALIRSEIDDVMIRDYGFANGPPHRKSTTEMNTTGIYRLLDQVKAEPGETS